MINTHRQRFTYIIGDFLMTNIAWFLFNVIRYPFIAEDSEINSLSYFLTMPNVLWGQLLFPLMMLMIFYLSGYYNSVFMKSRMEEILNTLATTFIGTILIYFIAIIDDPIPDRLSNYVLLIGLFAMMFTSVYSFRLFTTSRTIAHIRRGEWLQNAIIIGNSSEAETFISRMKSRRHATGIEITGFIPLDAAASGCSVPTYNLDNIAETCRANGITYIILIPPGGDIKPALAIINRLFPLDLPILITPDTYQVIMSGARFRNIIGEPLIDISRAGMSHSTMNLKRVSDILVSAVTLVILAPVFAAIAIAVRSNSAGPAIYRQERVGQHKKKFKILKFRTMYTDAEKHGPALSSADDSRITGVGKFLRKYRLDELPQFWNVLKGDMSLVGPRPEREYYIQRIVEKAPYYTLVHQVRPGITSWGMVKYGYASNVDEMIARLKYDLLYIENVSMLVDLKILFYTVHTVITGKGV